MLFIVMQIYELKKHKVRIKCLTKKNIKDRYSYLKTSSNKNENKTKACHYLEKPEHTQL